MKTETSDYLWLHLIVFIWGFTAILGLLIKIPAVEMVFYRTLLSAVGLGMVVWFRGSSFKIEGRQDQIRILVAGILFGTHWVLFFLSARLSNASVSLVGMATMALWSSLMEPFFLKSRLQWHQLILGSLAIIGILTIFQLEDDLLLGLVLSIVSAFLGAAFTIINFQLVRKTDHFIITLYEMIIGCILISFFFPLYKLIFGIAINQFCFIRF